MSIAIATTVSSATQAPATNRLTIQNLLQKANDLGEQAGKGSDTQIKFLLSCCEGGYHNAADLVPNKHGQDIDDATKLAEAYVKAQGTATVFDAKAPNQRKLVSTLRTAIKLGQWPKGGVGEPLATVNNLMAYRQKLRRDPVICKKLDDAANTFLKFARAQLKRDDLIEGDELNAFCLKKDPELPTAEKVLEGIKTSLQKLEKGQAAQNTALDNSPEVKDALKAVTKRLDEIAKGRKGGKV
jgi:hypothetical protein